MRVHALESGNVFSSADKFFVTKSGIFTDPRICDKHAVTNPVTNFCDKLILVTLLRQIQLPKFTKFVEKNILPPSKY